MKKVLHREHLSQDAVIYVGDETRDIEMSKKLHIPIVAVAWGFNAGKTLASLDPDALVHAPKDLLKSFQKIFDR